MNDGPTTTRSGEQGNPPSTGNLLFDAFNFFLKAEETNMPTHERFVFLAYANHGRRAWPGIDEIGKLTKLGTTRARKAVRELEKRRWLIFRGMQGEPGRQTRIFEVRLDGDAWPDDVDKRKRESPPERRRRLEADPLSRRDRGNADPSSHGDSPPYHDTIAPHIAARQAPLSRGVDKPLREPLIEPLREPPTRAHTRAEDDNEELGAEPWTSKISRTDTFAMDATTRGAAESAEDLAACCASDPNANSLQIAGRVQSATGPAIVPNAAGKSEPWTSTSKPVTDQTSKLDAPAIAVEPGFVGTATGPAQLACGTFLGTQEPESMNPAGIVSGRSAANVAKQEKTAEAEQPSLFDCSEKPEKPAKKARKQPPKLLTVEELSPEERKIHDAIKADPSLDPIVPCTAQTARDLLLTAPEVNVPLQVARAGGWLRANPARGKTRGAAFLLGWMRRQEPDAAYVRQREEERQRAEREANRPKPPPLPPLEFKTDGGIFKNMTPFEMFRTLEAKMCNSLPLHTEPAR